MQLRSRPSVGGRGTVVALLMLSVVIYSTCGGARNTANAQASSEQRLHGSSGFSRNEAISKEYRTLVEKYVEAYQSGRQKSLEELINYPVKFEAALKRIPPSELPPKAEIASFMAGWLRGQGNSLPFDPSQPKDCLCCGGVSYLGHQVKQNKTHVLLRVLWPDGLSPQYCTLILGTDAQGRAAIQDVWTCEQGSTADRIRFGIEKFCLASTARKAGKQVPRPLQDIRGALDRGGYSAAVNVIRSIPREAKRDRLVAVMCLMVASRAGTSIDLEAQRADFLAFFPAEQLVLDWMDLIQNLSTDAHDKAISTIERVEASVGRDPFLNLIRARIRLKQGDSAAAEKLARQVLAEEPNLPEVYDTLVHIAAAGKKFDQAVVWLEVARLKFPAIRPDLSKDRELRALVASPQFIKWQKENSDRISTESPTLQAKNDPVVKLMESLLADPDWQNPFPKPLRPWPATGDTNTRLVAEIRRLGEVQRDPRALNLLGVMYARGAGMEADRDIAIKYFKTAYKISSIPNHQWNLVLNAQYSAKEVSQIRTRMETDGFAPALMYQAYLLRQDYQKIPDWQRQGRAATELGKEIVSLYMRSSELRYARWFLAELYERGLLGVQKDERSAEELYKGLATEGCPLAQTALGVLLLRLNRPKEAIAWLQKGADADEPEAIAVLGCLQVTGKELERNESHGLALIRKSANAQNPKGGFFLGMVHLYGACGAAQNLSGGIRLLEQAIAHGPFPEAEYQLALAYGSRGRDHRAQARVVALLEKAATGGHADAKRLLDLLKFQREMARFDEEVRRLRQKWAIEDAVERDMQRIMNRERQPEEAEELSRILLQSRFTGAEGFLLFIMLLDGALNPATFLKEQNFGGYRIDVTPELECRVNFYWGAKLLTEGKFDEALKQLSLSVNLKCNIVERLLAEADLQTARTQFTANNG